MKKWLIAIRPWSFPASSMPVILTVAYLFWAHIDINIVNAVWFFFNIILFQAAGNTWSDYFDYKYLVDTKDSYGVKILTDHIFTPKQILCLSISLTFVASLAGFILFLRTGPLLLFIGIVGLLCSLLYPLFKYHALGDLVIFIAYAVLPIFGTSYVTTGSFRYQQLWMLLPMGLITVAILHANNTRDMKTDSRANITTFAMLIGPYVSIITYIFEVIFPFIWFVTFALIGMLPFWTLIILIALVPCVINLRVLMNYVKKGEIAIACLDELTAKLQLLFSLLLSSSFILSRFIA